jgi:hypothetical protein
MKQDWHADELAQYWTLSPEERRREVLSADVLQRRPLLCLYGLDTNAGLKRMCRRGRRG